MLDSELQGRKPTKGPHREVVGTTIMYSELRFKVTEGIESMTGIETFLILTVAAFDFSVVPGSIRADQLVSDTESFCCYLKQCRNIPFAIGKTVGKFETVICLDALNSYTFACIPS